LYHLPISVWLTNMFMTCQYVYDLSVFVWFCQYLYDLSIFVWLANICMVCQ
jgi:hypothetical protein